MILELINYIDINISLLNLVYYLTVRAGLALFTSFVLILFFGPALINYISSFQEDGQPAASLTRRKQGLGYQSI